MLRNQRPKTLQGQERNSVDSQDISLCLSLYASLLLCLSGPGKGKGCVLVNVHRWVPVIMPKQKTLLVHRATPVVHLFGRGVEQMGQVGFVRKKLNNSTFP